MSAPQYGQYGSTPAPDNNLVWAILSTVLCCLPLGIVAIIKAAQVNGLWAQGQFDAAHKSSQDAKKFSIWAAAVGGGLIVLYIVFMVVGVVGMGAGLTSSGY